VSELAHADGLGGVHAVLGHQTRHQLPMTVHRTMELPEDAPARGTLALAKLAVPIWFLALHPDLRFLS